MSAVNFVERFLTNDAMVRMVTTATVMYTTIIINADAGGIKYCFYDNDKSCFTLVLVNNNIYESNIMNSVLGGTMPVERRLSARKLPFWGTNFERFFRTILRKHLKNRFPPIKKRIGTRVINILLNVWPDPSEQKDGHNAHGQFK